MHRTSPLSRCAALVAVLTLAAAACTSPPASEDAAAPEPTTEAAAAETTGPAESSEPAEPTTTGPVDTGLVELELGETFTTDRGSEITAHEVQMDIPYDWEPDGGGAWHAINVSYCLSDTVPEMYVFETFTMDWIMRTEEGYVLDYPSSFADDIVQPLLDLYGVTPIPNECYRGWVLIDGPSDAKVTSVRFFEVDWAIPPVK